MRILPVTFLLMTSIWMISCSNEPADNPDTPQPTKPELVEMTFTATIESEEGDGETKTVFSRKDGQVRHVYWQEGDQISIFDGGDNRKFTLKSGAGTSTGIFQGNALENATTYYALYPYQHNASLSGEHIKDVNLPSSQTVAVNPRDNEVSSFDPQAGIMVAKSTVSNTFEFKNVCGFLRLVLAQTYQNVNKIAFTSCETENNHFLPLAGTLDIGFDDNGTPNATATSYSSSISLNSNNNNEMTSDTFYIAMLPNTFKGIFNISYITTNNLVYSQFYQATNNNKLEIKRSKIKGIGTPRPQIMDEWVDLGERKTDTIVWWRAWNLGAHNPQTAGNFYAWAETPVRGYKITYTPTTSSDQGKNYYPMTFNNNDPFKEEHTPYYHNYETEDIPNYWKYKTKPNSGVVGDSILQPKDDAATQEIESQQGVRIPTIYDLIWLQNNCSYFLVENFLGSGISGCVFKSKVERFTSKWIFMPMVGYCQDNKNYFYQKGGTSPYWSSNYAINATQAFVLFLNRNLSTDEISVIASIHSGTGTIYVRYAGCQIRPVKDGPAPATKQN